METDLPEPEITAAQMLPDLEILDLTGPGENSDAAGTKPTGKHHKESSGAKPPAQSPPTGIPTADEWQDFFGRIVLRGLTEGYLNLVLFRQVDESELTDRERDLVRLTREDLAEMARPLASYAYKNKHARKHGREIIAAADSLETMVDLFIWMRRVNRIARKYRKEQPGKVIKGKVVAEHGPVPEQDVGANGGPIVFNRGTG
jgi:ribosomal protein L35AE/L33A